MSQIEKAYAQALYGLAQEEQLEETFLHQLNILNLAFSQEPDFVRLLCTPDLSKQERYEILECSFRELVHPYILNFMKLLTEKGYMRRFRGCCKAYEGYYNEKHGILPVQAVTAVALTRQQEARLTEKLCTITGKTVKLDCRVEPSVLGGVRLEYDGKQVDGTVQSRLEALRRLLNNTVIEV